MHSINVAALSLQALRAACEKERLDGYRETSPACVELFRRAFAGNQTAWTIACEIVAPLMRRWVGVQPQLKAEDVIQEALLSFWRFAPQQPTLVGTDDLRPLLVYLRKTTKTALLNQLRRLPPGHDVSRQSWPSADGLSSLAQDFEPAVELQLLLDDYTQRALKTPQERLIFRLYFGRAMPPREILAAYRHLFDDVRSINTIIQRLARRLRATLAPLRAGES